MRLLSLMRAGIKLKNFAFFLSCEKLVWQIDPVPHIPVDVLSERGLVHIDLISQQIRTSFEGWGSWAGFFFVLQNAASAFRW